jgi:hypothetical protein
MTTKIVDLAVIRQRRQRQRRAAEESAYRHAAELLGPPPWSDDDLQALKDLLAEELACDRALFSEHDIEIEASLGGLN